MGGISADDPQAVQKLEKKLESLEKMCIRDSLFSVLYNHTLNVGRVQTPTLKMLVDRDAAITTFKKEKYYHVRLALSDAEAASERISDKAEADALKTTCEAVSYTHLDVYKRQVENIFENSDFVLMLNQAQGDRAILAKQLNISPQQMKYVTHTEAGEGLIFYGNVVLPFVDHFPKDTELYRIMTTKPEEVSSL